MDPIPHRPPAWERLERGQRCALVALGLVVLVTLVIFLMNLADIEDGLELTVVLIMFPVALALQGYAARRIYVEWPAWSGIVRAGWVTGALVLPLVAGFLAPIVLVIGAIALARSIWGGQIGAGWAAFGSAGSGRGSAADLGTWWGDDAVRYNDDGRASWVGDRPVLWSGGRISWVGDEQVQYGSDGLMTWIGDREVVTRSDGSPSWIGRDQVR